MTQALITKNARMTADNIIVGIQDAVLRKRLYVYANVIESLNDYFVGLGFSSSTKTSLYKNTAISSKFDIADFYIENMRVDVRICDDSATGILIPKQHKELAIEPDIYIVAKIDDEFKTYEIVGFIPSEQLVFDKEIQDYSILSPNKLLPMDRFKKLVSNIKIKKYKTKLSEKEILQLFVKIQEEDLSLTSQKALVHCLLANNSFVRKLNSISKMDNLSKSITNYPELLETIKPSLEEELAEDIEEVEEFEDLSEVAEIIDDAQDIDEVLEELHPKLKEIVEGTPKKRKPLILHVLAIILVGAGLLFFGLNNGEKDGPEKIQQSDKIINNAIIPNGEIMISKVSWGVSVDIANDLELREYLNTVGAEIRNVVSLELGSLIELPTAKNLKAVVILDDKAQYRTSLIKNSSGSKELDDLVLREVKNVFREIPPKNIRTSAPFIRAILIISL